MTKELTITSGAIVCKDCNLQGNITIGSMTVIHPKATIIAEAGPIVIGENNIIEEQSAIIHSWPEGSESPKELQILKIGANNVFEVGCICHAESIGNHNVLETKSFVGPGVELGTGCIIGAGCRLVIPQRLPDNTIVFGSECMRTVTADRPPAQTMQIDFLSKVLPNYHHIRRPH